MLNEASEAVCMEDVPAHESGDSFASAERRLANRADVVAAVVMRRGGETGVIAILLRCLAVLTIAEIRKTVQLDVNRLYRRRNDPRGRPIATTAGDTALRESKNFITFAIDLPSSCAAIVIATGRINHPGSDPGS